MRFLVLGCNGMAGHMVSLYLQEQGHQVLGFARERSCLVPSVVGDAMDSAHINEVIGNGHFDIVANCVGLLNRAAEEDKARAVYLNSYLPHLLVEVTSDMDTKVIHISTDCVFSGKRGMYTETDFRDGETFYDRSKALGELDDGKNLTIRCSIVGPDIKPQGIGLLNWFMQQKGPVYGYRNAIWTGLTTLELAKVIEAAAQQQAHGLYNMVPDASISKYELLKLFDYYLRQDSVEIKPDDAITIDKSLRRTRYDGFDYSVPDYAQMISELSMWMKTHADLYKHYNVL